MKKVKLPRKRKKAFINAKGRSNYIGISIFGELLQGESRKHADRYYSYGECVPTRKCPNGLKIIKRW